MPHAIFLLIESVSLVLGVVGIFILLVGAGKGFWKFLNPGKYKLRGIRLDVGSHTILGLDFLVCKDIIDTLLLDVENESQYYANLIGLFAVVLIRILLTHFTSREMKEIHEAIDNGKKREKK